jgi:hypothetical protein
MSRVPLWGIYSVAFSPQANYTDWATATYRRNLVPTFVDRGVSRGQRGESPTIVNLSFLDRIVGHILVNMLDDFAVFTSIFKVKLFDFLHLSTCALTHHSADRSSGCVPLCSLYLIPTDQCYIQYFNQNSWSSGICPSAGIIKTGKSFGYRFCFHPHVKTWRHLLCGVP